MINSVLYLQVEKMLSSPETLENLIAATPGLDKDPVAMGEQLRLQYLVCLKVCSHLIQFSPL